MEAQGQKEALDLLVSGILDTRYGKIDVSFCEIPEEDSSARNMGDPGSIPGSGRSPGEGNGNPLQYSCLENLMDGRSLVGYSPWGH